MHDIAADKMMVKAKGPVCHMKQKAQAIVPKRLVGLDKEAEWPKSKSDGWIYGHGTFCLCGLNLPVVLGVIWMPNAGDEAKIMGQYLRRYSQCIDLACMDSKADKVRLYDDLK